MPRPRQEKIPLPWSGKLRGVDGYGDPEPVQKNKYVTYWNSAGQEHQAAFTTALSRLTLKDAIEIATLYPSIEAIEQIADRMQQSNASRDITKALDELNKVAYKLTADLTRETDEKVERADRFKELYDEGVVSPLELKQAQADADTSVGRKLRSAAATKKLDDAITKWKADMAK